MPRPLPPFPSSPEAIVPASLPRPSQSLWKADLPRALPTLPPLPPSPLSQPLSQPLSPPLLPPLSPQLLLPLPSPLLSSSAEPPLQQRALLELLTSERSYVAALEQLSSEFVAPLRSSLSLLDHSTLFNNIDVAILPFQRVLLGDLESVRGSVADVARVFTRCAPFLNLYAPFVSGYTRSATLLSSILLSRPSLIAEPSRLESLLIAPVQRVPRYVLLLCEILRHGGSNNLGLSGAIDLVRIAARKLDSGIVQGERMSRVVELQRRLSPPPVPSLVAPHRTLRMEGVLKKRCRDVWRPYTFWLLSDILVYAANDVLHNVLTLRSVEPTPGVVDGVSGAAFTVTALPKSVTLAATSAKEAEAWLAALSQCLAEVAAGRRRSAEGELATATTEAAAAASAAAARGASKSAPPLRHFARLADEGSGAAEVRPTSKSQSASALVPCAQMEAHSEVRSISAAELDEWAAQLRPRSPPSQTVPVTLTVPDAESAAFDLFAAAAADQLRAVVERDRAAGVE